jgi:hypothetical protein
VFGTPLAAVRYLLERHLLDPGSVVDGDLVLTDLWSRNRCLLVRRAHGRSYVLKQGVSTNGLVLPRREAAVYEQLMSDEEGIGRYLPACYGYDPQQKLLILELVGNGETLRSYQLRRRRCSTLLARAVGDALGSLHRLEVRRDSPEAWNAPTPWVFSLHQPDLPALYEMSALSMQLTGMIQSQPDLCARLEGLRSDWRPRSIIHQDIKWDNVIVVPHPDSTRVAGIRLVDWEDACLGDPCWDVGSFLSEYLVFWLSTVPLSRNEQAKPPSGTADRQLKSMQQTVGTFWHAYVRSRGLGPDEANRWLVRALTFAAGRLLQTAFETTQLSTQLSGVVVLEVQLAANILQRPVEAAASLLGLPLEASASP